MAIPAEKCRSNFIASKKQTFDQFAFMIPATSSSSTNSSLFVLLKN